MNEAEEYAGIKSITKTASEPIQEVTGDVAEDTTGHYG
jgi:hypothetical protein